MVRPISIGDGTFEAEVIRSNVPVLVEFWAAWCGPCRAIAPILEELAEEYAGRLKIVKLDVDQNPLAVKRFDIQSVPALILFKNGKAVTQVVGVIPKHRLVHTLTAELHEDEASRKNSSVANKIEHVDSSEEVEAWRLSR